MTQSHLLYGTAWKEADTARCVSDALAAGFRAIDTANQRKHYFEAGVGEAIQSAIQAGHLVRSDLFLQTKFTFLGGQDDRLPYDPQADIATQVQQSFESSLEHLHTHYIDSLVLHGPSQRVGLGEADWTAWQTMETLVGERVHSLGVSNVSLEQLTTLYDEADIKPAFVQNRCYASTGWDRKVRGFCAANDVVYQGFSLLTANAPVFRLSEFHEIAQRCRVTPAQLVFRFSKQIGMWPLTGTTDPKHMREDLDAFGEPLSNADMQFIECCVEL